MTIIGLKTGDNGIQGLSRAHTHHHHPTPTPHEDVAALHPLLHFLSLSLAEAACSFSWWICCLLPMTFPLTAVKLFPLIFWYTHTHTHIFSFISFGFFFSDITLLFCFVHISCERCEMTPHWETSSVLASTRSDIAGSKPHTPTHTPRKTAL